MRSDLISHAFQMSTDANPKEQVPTSPNSTEQPDCALKSEGTPANFTEEELQSMRDCANSHKDSGNSLFSRQLYDEAVAQYSLALDAAPPQDHCRAIFFSNRAACFLSKGDLDKCISDCTDSLKIDPNYLKPLLRRAGIYEQRGEVIEAFTDFEDAMKKHPSNPQAVAGVSRLSSAAHAAREKQKAEMLGKLKEVGNSFLGLFGLRSSTDNFKSVQDPATGGYSLSFQQKP